MPTPPLATVYRFGSFEMDPASGELRRKGVRVRLHSQPFQVLTLLLQRPGEVLTREEICRELWPGDTFVDFDHGLNSAINRLRDALGDKASNPRFVETLARRGYRFLAPVEAVSPGTAGTWMQDQGGPAGPTPLQATVHPAIRTPMGLHDSFFDSFLATPEDLPQSSHSVVQTLFLLLQLMYLGFYIGALANLAEIDQLFSELSFATQAFAVMIVTAAVLIPVRTFLLCAVLFRAPRLRQSYLRLWPFLLPLDALWALAPFLLLHHINAGLALACMALLLYAPFAQRSLVLMGAGGPATAATNPHL